MFTVSRLVLVRFLRILWLAVFRRLCFPWGFAFLFAEKVRPNMLRDCALSKLVVMCFSEGLFLAMVWCLWWLARTGTVTVVSARRVTMAAVFAIVPMLTALPTLVLPVAPPVLVVPIVLACPRPNSLRTVIIIPLPPALPPSSREHASTGSSAKQHTYRSLERGSSTGHKGVCDDRQTNNRLPPQRADKALLRKVARK